MAVKYIAAFLTLADPRNFTCVSSQPWSALIDLSVILTGSYSILDTPTKHSYKKRKNRRDSFGVRRYNVTQGLYI